MKLLAHFPSSNTLEDMEQEIKEFCARSVEELQRHRNKDLLVKRVVEAFNYKSSYQTAAFMNAMQDLAEHYGRSEEANAEVETTGSFP